MIEVSEKKYWKLFKNYEDVLLYLALLNIDGKNDWRIMREGELHELKRRYEDTESLFGIWDEDMGKLWEHMGGVRGFEMELTVIPIRDA
jgi:hypothetical protein